MRDVVLLRIQNILHNCLPTFRVARFVFEEIFWILRGLHPQFRSSSFFGPTEQATEMFVSFADRMLMEIFWILLMFHG